MKQSTFRTEPATRQRVADLVFESLAKAILNGTFKPEEPLTTQRDLARQFNVSALVVRQAIHRLEDLGLVRVRQGSTTIVLDPNNSSDIRLIQLQMELEEPGPKLTYAVVENRLLFLLPMLVLAERRITEPQVAVLRHLATGLQSATQISEIMRLRAEFWLQVAKATDNPLFQQQVRWFSKLVDKLGQRGFAASAPRGTFPKDFYDKIVDALAAHHGAVAWYLEALGPMLDWADGRKAKAAGR
jgi:GntR family transcriptional repressor for pyruvate dehydrogenase complex